MEGKRGWLKTKNTQGQDEQSSEKGKKSKEKKKESNEPESARKRKEAARKIEGYIIQPKRWQRAQWRQTAHTHSPWLNEA